MTMKRDIDKVMRNMNTKIAKISGASMGGLLAGGAIVQAESMRRTPVEYGNLRASAFTRKAADSPDKKSVEVGYSASYAPWVHENLEMVLKGQPRKSGLGVYWGPEGEARFLANAAHAKTDEVVDAVARHVKKEFAA